MGPYEKRGRSITMFTIIQIIPALMELFVLNSVFEKYKTDTIIVNRQREIVISVSKNGGFIVFRGNIKNEETNTTAHNKTP
jgi:hypothetical protein